MDIVNNKLYITYYDKKTNNYITISQFKNRKHLLNCVLYSSFISILIYGDELCKIDIWTDLCVKYLKII